MRRIKGTFNEKIILQGGYKFSHYLLLGSREIIREWDFKFRFFTIGSSLFG